MKYFFTIFLFTTLITACKQKVLSGPQLDNKIIATMQDYLEKNAQPGVAFKVKDVTYYTDASIKSYRCEFHVAMHSDKLDTVGTMAAIISNDFKKVSRLR